MKKLLLISALTLITGLTFAQSVMTYCPGPGLNDGTDEGGINGGKDSFVYDELYTNNYGTAAVIATNPVSTCNLTNLQAYMKFDVSTLPAEADSVFLWFYNFPYNVNCYSNCDNTFDLRYLTSDWNEMTLTWENRPASGEPFSDTVRITFPYAGGPLKLDITDAYLAWKNGTVPNYGFTIFPLDGWCNNACVSFAPYASDEAETTKRPYLEIYYHSTGVGEKDDIFSQVTTYPNPATNHLFIDFSAARKEELRLTVIDFSGKVVESRMMLCTGGMNSLRVNTSFYSSGLFFYRLSASGSVVSGKFMVTKD